MSLKFDPKCYDLIDKATGLKLKPSHASKQEMDKHLEPYWDRINEATSITYRHYIEHECITATEAKPRGRGVLWMNISE